MEKESFKEAKFHKYFKKNPDQVLKNCKLIKSEGSLYGYLELLQDEINARSIFEENRAKVAYRAIGRIDVLFRYKSRNYCGEIKYYPFTNGEFWDALKVVGYTEYYNLCEKPDERYQPAILMPKNKIAVENMLIANSLKITIFGITETGDGYVMERIDDHTPITFHRGGSRYKKHKKEEMRTAAI